MLEPMSLARAGTVVRVADIRAMILQYLFCLADPGSADGCGSSGEFHGGRQVVMIMCNDVDGDCDDGDDDDDDDGDDGTETDGRFMPILNADIDIAVVAMSLEFLIATPEGGCG